jgi:hypothetical protein
MDWQAFCTAAAAWPGWWRRHAVAAVSLACRACGQDEEEMKRLGSSGPHVGGLTTWCSTTWCSCRGWSRTPCEQSTARGTSCIGGRASWRRRCRRAVLGAWQGRAARAQCGRPGSESGGGATTNLIIEYLIINLILIIKLLIKIKKYSYTLVLLLNILLYYNNKKNSMKQ